MAQNRRTLTLDSNVFIAAVKGDEEYSERCSEIIGKVPDYFLLAEPTLVYQEVCGTLARRAGLEIAEVAKKELDLIIHPMLLFNCSKAFCTAAYPLCSTYNIYAVDAIYLKVALDNNAVLVSLDKEDFIDKVKFGKPKIEAYHVSEFPY
jgi:predicted nucleic acid-binding protein